VLVILWKVPPPPDADHFAPAASFRNRGFVRSGSKLGSMRSQPGERKYGISSNGPRTSSAFLGSPTRMYAGRADSIGR
jgi:hypothetical protein